MTIMCACGYRAKDLEELKKHHILERQTFVRMEKKCTCKEQKCDWCGKDLGKCKCD